MTWRLSSSSDPDALAVVDGTGRHQRHGPHYSRRTPGSKTFTGCGEEIVLLEEDLSAVFAVVRQKTPAKRGTGISRGRSSDPDQAVRYVWRNMLFRNLGQRRSSELIEEATARIYTEWIARYGHLPEERLRTEVKISAVKSTNPGYCYLMAGWTRDHIVRGKLYLNAPMDSRQPAVLPVVNQGSPPGSGT